ncbi:Lys-gingipain precursor [Phycisphaerae bacterium RAS1]|nr:Lys-gingipain precursor [Phycisphaerae bacterium RAS1]
MKTPLKALLCAGMLLALVSQPSASRAASPSWLSVGGPAPGITPAQPAATVQWSTDLADPAHPRFVLNTLAMRVTPVQTRGGEFLMIDWPDSARSGDVGAPAIPVRRELLVVPQSATVCLRVIAENPIVADASWFGGAWRAMPVQRPVEKLPGARKSAPFDFDAAAYATDADLPAERAVLTDVGIFRGQRLMLLETRPVAYNPVAQKLTVWPQISVEVDFGHGAAFEPLDDVSSWLADGTANGRSLTRGQTGTGDIFMVVASAYASAITPFINAKPPQGYSLTSWTAAPGTTAAAIKTQIQNRYADPLIRPEYVLLVGDTDTIPYWTGGGEGYPQTDLNYVCMDGTSDWLPDIALGRFPVRSATQLQAMIDKTLYVENQQFADPGYLARAVFMASEDNYDITEGTHNWTITNYMEPSNIDSDMLYSHTYNATTQQVRNAFNAGRIFGIYSGHGSETSWADGPPFSQSDVNGLLNANMYPLVCSFACLTGNYVLTECFAETWVRAPSKGAAAIWASTVNSYWDEDDVLQRKLFIVLYDDYLREVGPAFNATKLRYLTQMGSGSTTRRYFEMYNLMGDPTLAIPEAQAALRVSPSGSLSAEGPLGGPFVPAEATYLLRNVADYAISYGITLEPPVDWLTVETSPISVLPGGTSVEARFIIDEDAQSLLPGVYVTNVHFDNLTDGIGDSTRQVVLQIGRHVFPSPDVPKPINDYSTITSRTVVTRRFCIADVNVDLNLTHTYVGDLLVTLTSPQGTVVTLHNRSGGGADNLVLTYDDEGSAPDGPGTLAAFDNQRPTGTWTLTVSDQAGADTGTLNSWTLRILPGGAACTPWPVGDMNCDGAANILDINAFVLAIGDPFAFAVTWPDCDLISGDLNGDGEVNILDINPFIDLVAGG